MGTDAIFQEAIEQSGAVCKLSPHPVNSIRAPSLLNNDGSVKIYSTIVRMGVTDAPVDNTPSGEITFGIKPGGCLKPVAYVADGTRYEQHPNTGLKIKFFISFLKFCS